MLSKYINQTITLEASMDKRINRIKEVLVIKGITQKALAAHMGRNPNTIASICNNKAQPHLNDFRKIAEFLDIDVRELLVATKEY